MHEPPDTQLHLVIDAAQVTADANSLLTHAVTAARHAGATWAQIGDAVGITGHAAKRRWRNHHHQPGTTKPPQPDF